MKLDRVEIKNFRSISNVTVNMVHGCEVIIGLNESGKSNILEALSLLDKEKTPNPSDIRNPHPNEAPITESYVRFVFKLGPSEITEAYEIISKRFFSEDIGKAIALNNGSPLDLKAFSLTRNEVIYQVDIADGLRKNSWYSIPKSFSMLNNWKIIGDPKNEINLVKVDGPNPSTPLVGFEYFLNEGYVPVAESLFAPFSNVEVLNGIIGAEC